MITNPTIYDNNPISGVVVRDQVK